MDKLTFMNFWNIDIEKKFFIEAMENFASVEQLFYKLDNEYFTYVPKNKNAVGQVLQSRNSLIGQYTEKWCKNFFKSIAKSLNLHAVNSVVCQKLGLSAQSNADLAFCTTNETHQKAENIKLLFEIKMSIVNNYKFKDEKIEFIGDYKTHKGSPSILRSDSMLKAIGKAINIRVSSVKSAKIPIIIVGNSPITKSYRDKVDFLKKAGIIQSFISLHPKPTSDYIGGTNNGGFQTFSKYQKLADYISEMISDDMNFFSSMLPKKELGHIIDKSAQEKDNTSRAEKFLQLINK